MENQMKLSTKSNKQSTDKFALEKVLSQNKHRMS